MRTLKRTLDPNNILNPGKVVWEVLFREIRNRPTHASVEKWNAPLAVPSPAAGGG